MSEASSCYLLLTSPLQNDAKALSTFPSDEGWGFHFNEQLWSQIIAFLTSSINWSHSVFHSALCGRNFVSYMPEKYCL